MPTVNIGLSLPSLPFFLHTFPVWEGTLGTKLASPFSVDLTVEIIPSLMQNLYWPTPLYIITQCSYHNSHTNEQ